MIKTILLVVASFVATTTSAQKDYSGSYGRTDFIFFNKTDTVSQDLFLESDSFKVVTIRCFNGVNKEHSSSGIYKVDKKERVVFTFNDNSFWRGYIFWDYDAPEGFGTNRKLVPTFVMEDIYFFLYPATPQDRTWERTKD